MSLDPDRPFSPADIPEATDWIRRVSGIPGLKVLLYERPYPPDGSAACAYYWLNGTGYEPVIQLNPAILFWHRQPVLCYKVYLMHEAGHVASNRTIPHLPGTREFAAHLWAVRKASRTGMERELRLLRLAAGKWLRLPRGRLFEGHRHTFRTAYRLLRRKGVL